MSTETIRIEITGKEAVECVSAILVPEIAISEPGYIKALTAKEDAHAKHEFHAMAQMAYFQFQDDELEIAPLEGVIRVKCKEVIEELVGGVLLYREADGAFSVLAHEGQNCKKLLEAVYRFCTRWVRLDI